MTLTRLDKKGEKLRIDSIKGEALNRDLDPARDYFKPDNGPSERAFHLVACGYDMLLTVSGQGFPTLDRRTRKKATKWMADASPYRGGQASTTLANLMARLMEQLDGRLTEDDEARVGKAHHRRLYKALEDFYPLENHKSLIFMCVGEFITLEKNRLREEVKTGEEVGSEYAQALLRGEDPSQDPRLVQIQRDWARDFFINTATFQLSRFLLALDFELIRDSAIKIATPTDRDLTGFREQQLDAWRQGMRAYMEYAEMDSAAADARGETPVYSKEDERESLFLGPADPTNDAPTNIPTGR